MPPKRSPAGKVVRRFHAAARATTLAARVRGRPARSAAASNQHPPAKPRSEMMARKRGRGMAASWYGIARTATVDRAAAWAEIDDGGTAKIVTGVTEIGEGILTVLAQIAAHEIGIRPQDVTIGDNDTARA